MPSLTLEEALAGRDAPPESQTAMRPMNRYLTECLDLEPHDVCTLRWKKTGSVKTRLKTDAARDARILAVVNPDDDKLRAEIDRKAPAMLGVGSGHEAVIRMVVPPGTREVTQWTVFEPAAGTVKSTLDSALAAAAVDFDEIERVVVTPAAVPLVPRHDAPPPNAPSPAANDPVEVDLVLDPRLRRMLRLAIASSKAVMLVGPPGTGKTTLLDEAIREARRNPAAYGLINPPGEEPLRVTPEEGWTTRELVGGETVDDEGHLRFRKGHVLDAIADDRWLVVDEANRADMDRIFGGLLTFLSGKSVTVGRTAGHSDAPPIVLDWNDEPSSDVEGTDALETGDGEQVAFLAGTDWRILGTYNALDAHRVFRFGQALGRRFARVPVPAIDVPAFRQALAPHLDRLEERHRTVDRARVEHVLAGLYEAHLKTPPVIGPAIFLSVPNYVSSGLDHQDAEAPAGLEELLVEGYMLGAGPLLAQLDPNALSEFRSRVVQKDLIREGEWQFLQDLLPTLA